MQTAGEKLWTKVIWDFFAWTDPALDQNHIQNFGKVWGDNSKYKCHHTRVWGKSLIQIWRWRYLKCKFLIFYLKINLCLNFDYCEQIIFKKEIHLGSPLVAREVGGFPLNLCMLWLIIILRKLENRHYLLSIFILFKQNIPWFNITVDKFSLAQIAETLS